MADQDLRVPLGRKDFQEELALRESLADLDRLGLKGHLDQLVPKVSETWLLGQSSKRMCPLHFGIHLSF